MKQYLEYDNHFGSIGLGVQSTAMALMSLHGDIQPKPKALIFADTGWERQGTYENLNRLSEECKKYDIPFYVVKNGHIREDSLHPTNRSASLPYYITDGQVITVEEQYEKFLRYLKNTEDDGLFTITEEDKKQQIEMFLDKVDKGIITDYINEKGKGMMMRQCTIEYKIVPLNKKIKLLSDPNKHQPAVVWIGISTDEALRMKESKIGYTVHRWPLVELRMNRQDCIDYLESHNYPVPCRSSCIGCPFHNNEEWKSLNSNEVQDVRQFEKDVNLIGLKRKNKESIAKGRIRLHFSTEPIDTEPYKKDKSQLSLFDEREQVCDGGCWL